jgi:hypothetical protein
MDTQRIAAAVAELEAELRETEVRAEKLRHLILGAREFLPRDELPSHQIDGALATEAITVNGKGRPPLKAAVLTVLRLQGAGGAMSLAALTEALWQRGWVGATKDGTPSKETVRGALLRLQRQGLLEGKEKGDTSWEPTLWRLSNTIVPRPVDLYSEGGGT